MTSTMFTQVEKKQAYGVNYYVAHNAVRKHRAVLSCAIKSKRGDYLVLVDEWFSGLTEGTQQFLLYRAQAQIELGHLEEPTVEVLSKLEYDKLLGKVSHLDVEADLWVADRLGHKECIIALMEIRKVYTERVGFVSREINLRIEKIAIKGVYAGREVK